MTGSRLRQGHATDAAPTGPMTEAELRRRLERAELTATRLSQLQEVTSTLASALTIDQIVDWFSALGAGLFGAVSGVIYLRDSSDRLHLQGAYGISGVNDVFKVVALDAPVPLSDAVRNGQPLFIETYEALLRTYPVIASARTPATKLQAMAAMPLVDGSRVLGGVVLGFETPRSFEPEEREWLLAFARQLAIATARSQSYTAEQEARAEAERLLRVAEALNASQLDLEAVVQKVTDEATAAVGAKFGAFFYNQTDASGQSYVLYTLSGAPRETFDKVGPPRNTPLFAPTFAGAATVRIDDVRKDPRYGRLSPHHGMPAGHLPVVSYLATPVVSRTGTVLGGLFFGHPDIGRFTEQHERVVGAIAANAAVAIDNARLYRTTMQAEAQQRQLVDELTETIRVNETLVGVLAHDLRNPLNAILASAELAIAKTRTDGEVLRKPLTRITASGRRMGRMIEQLLDLSRLRVGELIALEPKPCDLDPLIRHVLDELNDPRTAEALRLEINGDTRGTWDPDRLSQVFSNLVGNALHHRSGGTVKVSLRGAERDLVRVTIHNEGAIPAEIIPKLFEPFTGGQRRRTQASGLGLGLFITRQLALAHGGSVEVNSTEAEGTTFTVSLPRFPSTASVAPDGPRPLQEARERAWQSEQRMRLLIDSIRDCAIYMLDAEGRVTSWNPGAERLKGFRAPEILGKHFSTFFLPDDIAAGRPAEELRIAKESGTYETEGWRLRKDGSSFWANVMIGAVRDRAGTLLGYYKVTRDLTDRRRAEQEIRESENRLRLIVDGVKDYAIYLLDPTGVVQTWNTGARETKGYTREEIVGKNFALFFPPEARAAGRPAELLRLAAERGRVEDANWRVRKDGTLFWADVVITALRDETGALVGFSKVVRDLTDRRRAAEELRHSEERFRLMVDAVKDYAIFMLDVDGKVSTWNAGAQRLKQYTAAEIIGQHFSRFYPSEVAQTGICERELEIAAREGRFEDEGWRVRKDGTQFWANVVITALRGADGHLIGFTKVTRDLTDRRRLEEERVRLAEAHAAIKMRDEFLSLVSHELKTPVAALQMQLEILGDNLHTEDKRLGTTLRRASMSSHRLAALIESILDVSRLGTGRFTLERTRFDFAQMTQELLDGLEAPASKIRCPIERDIQGPIFGSWDRVRIEQVITNLLSNALKYGAGQPIQVSVRPSEGGVRLQVRDGGPGLGEHDVARLFERFERAASVRHHGGLGLGLYLVREIVHAHGGTVTAENAAPLGALLTVFLPLTPPPPAAEGQLS